MSSSPHDPAPPSVAVNGIGSWSSTTGLAEAARRTVRALVREGVRVALHEVDFGAPTRPGRLDAELASLDRGRHHPIDLCFVNINETMQLDDATLWGGSARGQRHLIGFWYWELPFMPAALAAQAARVDAIWVASRFVAETMRAATEVPVTVVPVTVEPAPDPRLARRDFGLPTEACLYLFSFDAHSTLARKNPWDLVRVFRHAFSREELGRDVRLVVKAINLASLPDAQAMLRAELASINGILVEEDLTSAEMASLLSCADVYVSLHRAEGFGLGLAESMYLGVPVIATAYSGNMDYMTVANSIPVGYRLRGVDLAELGFNPGFAGVYGAGNLWAEPNLAHAARAIRRLFEQPRERARLGAEGATTIRDRYSATSVGRALRVELERVEGLDA